MRQMEKKHEEIVKSSLDEFLASFPKDVTSPRSYVVKKGSPKNSSCHSLPGRRHNGGTYKDVSDDHVFEMEEQKKAIDESENAVDESSLSVNKDNENEEHILDSFLSKSERKTSVEARHASSKMVNNYDDKSEVKKLEARDEASHDIISSYLAEFDNRSNACSFDTGIHTVPLSSERQKKTEKKQESINVSFESEKVTIKRKQATKKERCPCDNPTISVPPESQTVTATDSHNHNTDENVDWPRIATAAALNVMKNGGSDKLAELASTTVLRICGDGVYKDSSGDQGNNNPSKKPMTPYERLDIAASQASAQVLRSEMNASLAGMVGVAILRAGVGILPTIPEDDEGKSSTIKNATYMFLSCCSLKYL